MTDAEGVGGEGEQAFKNIKGHILAHYCIFWGCVQDQQV